MSNITQPSLRTFDLPINKLISPQIGRLDGVILLNWDDSTLERQIEYGVKMGEIEFEAAKGLFTYDIHNIFGSKDPLVTKDIPPTVTPKGPGQSTTVTRLSI